MADWYNIAKEIRNHSQSPIDSVRKKYIKRLSALTGRNVICYYSGFLTVNDSPDVSINDRDMNGFMTVIHGMDKSKGLDLIIHSPGGEVTATEMIGNYLRKIFGNDIRIFVPQMAMSGGTMLACIGKEIYLGKHSSIGPIDPQCRGVPAHSVIQEFEEAKEELEENPKSIVFWQQVLNKYPPTFIGQCYKAVELSTEVAENWLKTGDMFSNDTDEIKNKKIKTIVDYLNNNTYTKIHSRHIGIDKARELGLNVIPLEQDDKLQDMVLSIHHCYMHTFQNTNAVKLIENQNNGTFAMIMQDNN
ncbi:MAG: ATP-dependent Clp protease proteolytic subunit [Candidatus Faecenecus gallistercoris]|nr:ATP-dependent Clp protease proteolytic subunit [Bacillota bacterium]MDY4051015.1 ATP-dependent Clp protease proteolytic subunit [Candidatus Faecenecus gallistercoris]